MYAIVPFGVPSLGERTSVADIATIEAMRLQFAELARELPLEMLDLGLQVAAQRINDFRDENGGNTPGVLWKTCIEFGPSYACLELVLWIVDGAGRRRGVALQKREAADQGWQGTEHVNGRALLPHQRLGQIQEKLLDEITEDEGLRSKLRTAFGPRAFIDVHREDPDRRVNCMTAVYEAEISAADFNLLKPGFVARTMAELNDKIIVDHHRRTLAELRSLSE